MLLYYRTTATLAERVIETVTEQAFTVHSMESMVGLFKYRGFQLVSQRSNNISALLLFRKTVVTVESAEPLLLKVNNTKYDWVEVMKSNAFRIEREPPGHNLWLLAEDCSTSGVVGLMNCLRLETGGSHVM